jgi:hypothetical protein
MMEIGVTNPLPDMRRIAIIPFLNLSEERAVDGRRFAEMYYSELQKTPGFQVLPVGVVEAAIQDRNFNLDNPADIPKLAEMLNVDCVVVGAVTEYTPYYPPRIGLQVSWYATENFRFAPGIPIDPGLRDAEDDQLREERKSSRFFFRAQSPDDASVPVYQELPSPMFPKAELMPKTNNEPAMMTDKMPEPVMVPIPAPVPAQVPGSCPADCDVPQVDMHVIKEVVSPEPIMSYTRIFDGSDSALVANLRDYVELSGDQRSGGWEGYLQRSDDYIRYCMHRMIVEMIQLHGGETRRKVVFAKRKLK